jgi:hypothetical protein
MVAERNPDNLLVFCGSVPPEAAAGVIAVAIAGADPLLFRLSAIERAPLEAATLRTLKSVGQFSPLRGQQPLTLHSTRTPYRRRLTWRSAF